MTATYLTAMVVGLLVVQLFVFFMTLKFRSEEQFQLMIADRTRVAVSLYEAFASLRPQLRVETAGGLNYASFNLRVEPQAGFESGQDDNSQYLLGRVQRQLLFSSQASLLAEAPEIRARVNDFDINWVVFPSTSRPASGPGNNSSSFDAKVAIALDERQWLLFDFNSIMRIDNNLFWLILELVAQFILIMLLAVVITRHVAKPLRQMADYADHFVPEMPGPPPGSLPNTGPSEVVRTSRAMQAMYQRLRRYLDERVRMLASISHDLRNPIHLIRLYLEKDTSHSHQEQLLDALDDLQRLADDAVTLARTGVNKEALRVTDIQALLGSLISDYTEYLGLSQDGAVQKDEVLRFHRHPENILCQLRPLTFKRCVQNIVDNALRYGKEADIYLEEHEGQVLIRITDKGPGIPEHLLDEVFQPFFRHDVSRSSGEGNGLGLNIARDLAWQNNAELTCRNLPQGGLEVRISLAHI